MKKMKKFFKSFYFAYYGIVECFKTERNFKVHSISALAIFICSFLFKISSIEWMFIIMSVVSVMTTEIINTAIEKTADFIEPNRNDTIRKIKDMTAGMVLITAIGAFIIACIIFIPKVLTIICS